MIVRSVIFFLFQKEKELSIDLAKKLKGYVDIENIGLNNPHIDYSQYHNIIFVSLYLESLSKMEELFKEKEIYGKNLYVINDNVLKKRYISSPFDVFDSKDMGKAAEKINKKFM